MDEGKNRLTSVDRGRILDIGKKIKELRLIRGMTQNDLGKKVYVSFQQIQKYEHGQVDISFSKLISLANALSIEVTYFFSDTDSSNPYLYNERALHESESNCEYNHNKYDDAESKEMLNLIREYKKIKNKASRKAVYLLVKSLAFSAD